MPDVFWIEALLVVVMLATIPARLRRRSNRPQPQSRSLLGTVVPLVIIAGFLIYLAYYYHSITSF